MADTAPKARQRILVIDDDPMVRLLAGSALQHAGFHVAYATGGREGVELFRRTPPHLVLLDALMPGMDGFEVCRELRGLAEGTRTPILMMTRSDDVTPVRQAYDAGATDFVTKPLDWQILEHRVRYLLRGSAAVEALHRSEERFRQLADNLDAAFWIASADGAEFLYVSPPFERLWGVPPAELQRDPQLLTAAVLEADAPTVAATLTWPPATPQELEYRIHRSTGETRWIRDRRFPIRDATGEVYRVAAIAEDVTARREADEQIHFMAYFDGLTGLPNRAMFKQRLAQALQRASRSRLPLATLFLDVDFFKRINDTLGHRVGDRLLEEIADRLRRCVRATDLVARSKAEGATTIARLGGDEFTLLLERVTDGDEVARICRRLLDALGTPFEIEGHEVFVTVSIGVALSPGDGTDVDTLLRNADAAMYSVKATGRNDFHFYERAMNAAAADRLRLEGQLRRALERDEFRAVYQPQIDVFTGRVVGVEALLRWHHPERGVVSPAEFMPLLEETGLIVPVGDWMLQTACAQWHAWAAAGIQPRRLGVNLSGRQFQEGTLVAKVRSAIADHALPPETLELELTESILMHDAIQTVSDLHQLRQLGARLAIDDFGTGYSSLSYLKRFPINTLKIDRSFVHDVGANVDDAALVSAIIAMACSLGIGLVAEGVETAAQRDFLQGRGCFVMQGHLLSPPLPPEAATAVLRRQPTAFPEPRSLRELPTRSLARAR